MRVCSLLLLLLLSVPIAALGQINVGCSGPYSGKILNTQELQRLLGVHNEWRILAKDPNEWDSRRADLCGAKLLRVNLTNANLTDVRFEWADLTGATMVGANLSGVNLRWANLSGANLRNATMPGTDISLANLAGSRMMRANLSGSEMMGTNLSGADLSYADLSNAYLVEANLSKANLSGVDLSGAILTGANLSGTKYELLPGKQPLIDSIATAKGLSGLTYDQPRALVNLRKLLKDGGYRHKEREITYSINHVRTERLLDENEDPLSRVEGAFNYVLFEITTKWGLAPSRALFTIALLILIFSLAYVIAIWSAVEDGIWIVWSDERVRKDLGKEEPVLITRKDFNPIRMALYFSLLSAFHIGWRDLNVGNWITRVQPREYTLRASGWVRTVSGIQSLLSVYLLAIWALTYFGRPFE